MALQCDATIILAPRVEYQKPAWSLDTRLACWFVVKLIRFDGGRSGLAPVYPIQVAHYLYICVCVCVFACLCMCSAMSSELLYSNVALAKYYDKRLGDLTLATLEFVVNEIRLEGGEVKSLA